MLKMQKDLRGVVVFAIAEDGEKSHMSRERWAGRMILPAG